jgi:DNA-binding CsgD family transcriptional regulator
MTGQLRTLGLDENAERLYRRILRDPDGDLGSHVSALGWTRNHGRAAYEALVSAGLVSESRAGALVPEAPRVAIGRLIEQESARLDDRRRELDDVQAVIADLASEQQSSPPRSGEFVALDVVPQDEVVAAYEHAMRSTTGPIRHIIKSTSTTPARDEALVRWAQGQVARGRVLHTLYPTSFLRDGNVEEQVWIRHWADVGEQQRLLPEVPHAFTVFGDELVLSCSQWGVVTEDLVAIRSPLLIQSFAATFDDAWQRGLPVPHTTFDDEGNDRLLTMLASGLKDEAIARYLGVSLRTVRRRVAMLMEDLGAHTRFQLGSAAERRGLLDR